MTTWGINLRLPISPKRPLNPHLASGRGPGSRSAPVACEVLETDGARGTSGGLRLRLTLVPGCTIVGLKASFSENRSSLRGPLLNRPMLDRCEEVVVVVVVVVFFDEEIVGCRECEIS